MQGPKQQDDIKQEWLEVSTFALKNEIVQIENLEHMHGASSSKYHELPVKPNCFYLRWHLLKDTLRQLSHSDWGV